MLQETVNPTYLFNFLLYYNIILKQTLEVVRQVLLFTYKMHKLYLSKKVTGNNLFETLEESDSQQSCFFITSSQINHFSPVI